KIIECTPAFKNCVQVTACLNIGAISGMNGRKWDKHGKLPYITYDGTGTATQPTEKPENNNGSNNTGAELAFKVGDVVCFTGNKHYTSANATSGATCTKGTAKVTAVSKGAKHPYHLIKQSGGGSSVYGWVDAQNVASVSGGATGTIKPGSTVKVKIGAKTYGGKNLASFVYTREHIVKEIEKDRAVITYGGIVVAAVKISDLTLIK
ncbi:MAG: hypothetical protein RR444_06005, partial [Oscillospiraceae bacterium]